MAEVQMSEKEKRVRAITKLYYSNPAIQKAILDFSQNREVSPRYFEGFGKRPDVLTYPSDIIGLVNKGATSFHCSEEIWTDPLSLKTEMTPEEVKSLRKSWDLLIDVDSPFLDCSKIATKLLIAALEHHGIKNFGIKFSGSKGFHIIVSGKAFPEEYSGMLMKESFPEWPRAISEYLMNYIRGDYNKQASEVLTNFEAIERRTNVSKEDLLEVVCSSCGEKATPGKIIKYSCPVCNLLINRKEVKQPNKRLRCLNGKCGGILNIASEEEYYFCQNCKDPENDKISLDSERHSEMFEKSSGVRAEKVAALDMILVAPRHLFRTPYSLNEKTSLASVVLTKEELENFSPKDASPMGVKIHQFMPANESEEAKYLLAEALKWKRDKDSKKEEFETKKYASYEKLDIQGVSEDLFPEPIKKLLLGLSEGKKRGLFILLTFLKALNFAPEYIMKKINDWNKLNNPPLKDGYVKSQVEWHLRQKRQILPPNYDNASFYKDLNLLDKKPTTKNPIVDVMRRLRSNY